MFGKKKVKDPYHAREAKNYANPIPSREYILSIVEKRKRPISVEQLIKQLQVADSAGQEALRYRLSAMVRDCQLLQRGRGFLPADYIESTTGIVCADVKGQRMVLPDDGGEVVYLYPNEAKDLYDGDRIVVNINRYDENERAFGALVEILEAIQPTVVGKWVEDTHPPMVIPLDQSHPAITIEKGSRRAKAGNLVVACVNREKSTSEECFGELLEVLGDPKQPGIFTEVAIRSYDIPTTWSATVLQQCDRVQDIVPPHEIHNRIDVRDYPLVTIDGEDARDFDDAVYCERLPRNRFRLLVAIADVSHYVKAHTPLDKEAYQRGNSVYFPDKVVPMLPEPLSNGICSLKPHVERLCVICEMEIDGKGKIGSTKFYEAVMRSHARLTYTEVTALLEGNSKLRETYASLVEPLQNLEAIYHVLDAARQKRGAIAFETVETQILFDEHNHVRGVVPRHRSVSHKIIEECMLAANVAAANFLKKHHCPTLYRIHEGPTRDKLMDLRALLGEYGVQLRGAGKPSPRDYNEVIAKIEQFPNRDVLQTALLRSLSQAMYSPENIGHFGLAYEEYLHFTSPIRRYPDLLVHRAIKMCLVQPKGQKAQQQTDLLSLGEHCSHTERRADEATREVVQALKCQYLQARLGEVFIGTVTQIVAFGLFVSIHEVYTEGLIHVRKLGAEYFHYDNIKHRMIGDVTRKIYQIGDVLTVQLVAADPLSGKVDLILYQSEEEPVLAEKPNFKKKKKAMKSKGKFTHQSPKSGKNAKKQKSRRV